MVSSARLQSPPLQSSLTTPSSESLLEKRESCRLKRAFVGLATNGTDLKRSPMVRVQELCESRGGRPGLSVLMSLTVSVDVKQH